MPILQGLSNGVRMDVIVRMRPSIFGWPRTPLSGNGSGSRRNQSPSGLGERDTGGCPAVQKAAGGREEKLFQNFLGMLVVLDDEVQLRYYRLQKTSEGSISLQPGNRGAVSAPTAVGTGIDRREPIELSRLIDIINERFGTDFKPADQLFFDQIKEEAVAGSNIQQAAIVNSLENFGYVFDKALEDKFIDRMDQNQEIFARYMNNKDFQKVVADWMRKQVYEQIREDSKGGPATAQGA